MNLCNLDTSIISIIDIISKYYTRIYISNIVSRTDLTGLIAVIYNGSYATYNIGLTNTRYIYTNASTYLI